MEYDINAYFSNEGYVLKKDMVLVISQDEATSLWEATLEDVDVYAYGITKQQAYEQLIECIYTQVRRHREYKGQEVKGKVLEKLKFISEHLEE